MKIKLDLVGLDRELSRMKKVAAAGRKIIRRAVEKGATIQLQAERVECVRQRTGLLKKSLGKKVKSYPNGVVVGVTGPRRGFRVELSTDFSKREWKYAGTNSKGKKVALGKIDQKVKVFVLKGKNKGQRKVIDPTKYAHLVEGGHQRGKGRSAAKAYPFIKPAGERSATRAYVAVRNELAAKLGSETE